MGGHAVSEFKRKVVDGQARSLSHTNRALSPSENGPARVELGIVAPGSMP